MPITVARFEPPANDALRAAAERFDCVRRKSADGTDDPGEAMVRDFLRSGAYADAAAAGVSTTYLAIDTDARPVRLLGYLTASSTQIRLTSGERKGGSLSPLRNADFGAVRIAMIGVDGTAQGVGVGKLLLEAIVTHTARMSRDVSVRFVVADAVHTQLDWYRRQGFVENRSQAERDRLARVEKATGIVATSMRLDLGPDPRVLLE